MSTLNTKIRALSSAVEDELLRADDYNAACRLLDSVAAGREATPAQAEWIAYFAAVATSPERPERPASNWIEAFAQTPRPAPAPVPRRGPRRRAPRPVLTPAPITGGPFIALVRTLDASVGRFPSVTYRAPSGFTVHVQRAGQRARMPGTLNITNGLEYGAEDNIWYGRITRDGEFQPARDFESRPEAQRVRDALATLTQHARP